MWFILQLAIILIIITQVCMQSPLSSSYGVPQQSSGPYPASHGYNENDYNDYYDSENSYEDHHDHHDHHENSAPKSYEFGYAVKDDYTGNDYGRKESSDGNTVHGEYRVSLPDGRVQIVTYYADWKSGFHANVKYEGEAQYPKTWKVYTPPEPTQYGPPSPKYGPPTNQFSSGY